MRRLPPPTLAAASLLALLLVAAPAEAFPVRIPGLEEPLRIDITNSLYLDYHLDNGDDVADDNYFDLRNRLNLDLSLGDYTLGGRFDMGWFPDPATSDYQSDWFRAEKVYLRVHKTRVAITLGDFYAVFGRGISLYFRKVDEISSDPSLRGGMAAYRDDFVRITVLAGLVNEVNIDDFTEKLREDPNDLVVGARLEGTIAELVTLGAHGVMLLNRKDFPPENDFARQDRLIAGATVDLPDIAGMFSFYGEFDAMWKTDIRYGAEADDLGIASPTYAGRDEASYAGYAAATLDVAGLTSLVEFRWYDGWSLVETPHGGRTATLLYVRPPTLERIGERNIHNLENSWGLRGRFDYSFDSGTIVFANIAHFWDEPARDGRTLHVYGGVTQRVDDWGFLGEIAGGYRWAQEPDQRAGASGLRDRLRMWHVDLDVQLNLYGPHSVELAYHHEGYEDLSRFRDQKYHLAQLAVTYSFAPWLDAAFLWGYTTEIATRRAHYFGGEVRVRFKSDSFVRLFGGQMRGGLVCINGACRDVPPFEGVRAEVVVRF